MRPGLLSLAVAFTVLLAPGLGFGYPSEGGSATDCTVEMLDHQMIALSSYSDQILVLFLLGASDSRCSNAAPAYEQNVHLAYKERGVTILGVDVDQTDTFDDLASFRDQHGITFPLAMDTSGKCWGEYQADEEGHVPVFYVIDRHGIIRHIELGYRTGREENIIEAIEMILFEERPAIAVSLNRELHDMTPYQAGQTMEVYASVSNPGYNEVNVVVYIAASVGGTLFFWPSFGAVPEGVPITLPSGFALDNYQVASIPLFDGVPRGIHAWYALLVDAGTGEWASDLDVLSWPFGYHERPASDRASLVPPDDLWDYVCSRTGGQPLGYTEQTMTLCNFYGHEFRLNQVWDLWRNVNDVTTFSGEVGDYLLAYAGDPAGCLTYCYDMLAYEGQTRGSNPTSLGGVRAPADFVFDSPADQTNYEALQQEVRDFVEAITAAAAAAGPVVESAFDKAFIAEKLGVSVADLDAIDRWDLYILATEPWRSNNCPSSPGFEMMHKLDLPTLSQGTSVFVSGVQQAIGALKAWLSSGGVITTGFETIEFTASAGKVLLCGTGDEWVMDPYSLIIDLGGDDSYVDSQAVPRSFGKPVGAIVDVEGCDNYDGLSSAFNFCCGLFGVGAVFDLEGEDIYSSGQSGIASAWHGTGLVVDYDGDDIYISDDSAAYWCQGAAHGGVGLLMDLAGDDSYSCLRDSQGFGSSLGVGAILDVSGDDIYDAEGVYSDPFYNNVAFAQGAADGRRADSASGGDGRSLAGGIGILVDGDGCDDYWGPVYVQGCAYWWSLGILEDRGGDDNYRCWEYSMGSAPHMAIGCMVDLSGDDCYNTADMQEQYRYLGHARDGSIGIFLDGDGSDAYLVNRLSGGSGDLNSIGYFWDRYGDDLYYASTNSQSFGAGYPRGDDGTFRDTMANIGVFLDTQGLDEYVFAEPGVGPSCEDSMEWQHQDGPVIWGYGLDMDWYGEAE